MHPTELPGTVVILESNVVAAGGSRLAVVDWKELAWQETSSLGASTNRGYARFVLSADSPAINYVRSQRVIRIDDPQNFGAATNWLTWEFRISEIDDSVQTPDVVVTCVPIIQDLGRTILRAVNGGVTTKTVNFTGTAQAFIETLVLPALAAEGISHFSLGTIEPTATLTFSGRNVSCLALLTWLEQQTTSDAWCSRPNETTFALNLTRRGASDPTPLAFVGRNCIALDRTIIIDDRFATRVEPEGRTPNDETEPTHIGQAAMLAESESARVVTVADPGGGDPLIGVDDELNGKRAFYALDPLHFAVARTPLYASAIGDLVSRGQPLLLAIDSTRRILWGYTQCDGDTLWWRSLVDDAASGEVALGSSALWLSGLGYDAVNDRIVACCGDQAKVVLVNASTKAVSGTVTMAYNVAALCGIANGKAFIGYAAGASAAIDVVTTSGSGAISTSLANTAGWDTRVAQVMYHTGQTRYFAFHAGDVKWYNSSLIYVSAATGLINAGAKACLDSAQTNIACFSPTTYQTINPSTGALVINVTLPAWPYVVESAGSPVVVAVYNWHNRFYLLTTVVLVAFDGTNWLTPAGDVGTGLAATYKFAQAVEVPPSANENAVIYTGDIGCVRRLVATKNEDLLSPFEAFTIVDTDAANQRITAPASGSGGPVDIPTEADGAGQGALIEVRENAALDYRTTLSDPAAVAAYGVTDAVPQYDVYARRNYWRGSAADSWRSGNTNRWGTLIFEGPEYFGALANRWQQADQTGFAQQPVTLSATWHNDPVTPDLTLSVSGLNNGTVLSPGDIFALVANPTYSDAKWFVRQRAVADGSGNATVPVTPLVDGALNVTSGTTVYLSSSAVVLANGRTETTVLYPTRVPTLGTLHWPTLAFTTPVPRVSGDQRAWAYIHVTVQCWFLRPKDISFSVLGPFRDTVTSTTPIVLHPEGPSVLRNELREYWLAQPIDLINMPSHGFVTCQLSVGNAFVDNLGTIYIQSAGIILGSADPTSQDVYGADGPNTLLQLGRARLLAGNTPSTNYRLQLIEDQPAKPFTVGVVPDLRDPTRGISLQPPNGPRVTTLTRRGKPPGVVLSQPEVELGNAPLDTFIANIVKNFAKTTTTSTTTTGSAVTGVVTGGGVGTPPAPAHVDYIPILAHNAH
jgi:hypothetical protein